MDELQMLYSINYRLPKINPFGKEIRGVKPIINKTFFEYNFESAFDFLDVFDVNKSELYFEGHQRIFTDYLYRGHKYSDWLLLPNIYRKESSECDAAFENRVMGMKCGNGNQKEIEMFVNFVKGLDHLGYDVSESSFDMINFNNDNDKMSCLNLKTAFSYFDFPKVSQLNELALAQHYGVKTRLLDFTEDPLIAVFFASESSYPFEKSDNNDKKKIGVWVIPKLLIEVVKRIRYLDYIDVKKFQNKYITAQRGVFINYFPSNDYFRASNLKGNKCKGDSGFLDIEKVLDITITLDQILAEDYNNVYYRKLIDEHIGKPMLFTLPHNELDIIARRLNQLNINWITLMPSLDGVKKEVERQNKKPYSNPI